MAEVLIGFPKQSGLILSDFCVFYFVRIEFRNRFQILSGKKFFLNQQIRTDEKGLSCKDRKTLIRRVSIATRAKGQNLPEMLTCHVQKVNEVVCFLPHITDPIRRWEGSRMSEDSAVAVIGFVIFSYFKVHNKFPHVFIHNLHYTLPGLV